jgi:DNA polymerase III delta subunit
MKKLNSLGKVIKDIHKNKINSSYFLYGDDIFMQDFFINEFKKIKKNADNFLYYLGYDQQDYIFNQLSNLSLFNNEKIIIIKNITRFSAKSKKELLDYLSKENSGNYIIFVKNNFDNKNKFIESLMQKCITIDVRTPFDNKVKEWIRYITKKEEIPISDTEITDYINAYGSNISSIINYIKIDFLSNHKNQTQKNRTFYLWHLQDAIGKKELVKSLDIYESLLSNGNSINLILIYLYRLFEYIYNSIDNYKQIYSNFAVNKVIQSRMNTYSSKYSMNELENIILKLKSFDFLSKTSSANIPNLNRCLIANACKGYYE